MNSVWDLVSDGIVTEILTRLPAKQVCRLKLVSKHWNSVITQPEFLVYYITRPSSPWVILNRIPKLALESDSKATHFNLVEDPTEISPSSINPYKLALEPAIDPTQDKYPTAILHSSNGILLVTLSIKRDPHKAHEKDPNSFMWAFSEESLYVVNPVTNEWVPLPQPRQPINKRTHVAFTARLHPNSHLVDKFILVEYQPLVGSTTANLLCFSSDLGKWVELSADYMLGWHFWRAEGSFEFQGRLWWVDLSTGLITLDTDPFLALESKDKAVCRFIPIPTGRTKPYNTLGLENQRRIDSGCGTGGFIQYMEVFQEGDFGFKLWRLKDCQSGEWDLMYKVSRDLLGKGIPRPCFVHPFQPDVVYFHHEDDMFSLNVRTCKVETRISSAKDMFVLPMLLPKWPSPLPKPLYAAYAKELGNECFKNCNFNEAIDCYSKSIDL